MKLFYILVVVVTQIYVLKFIELDTPKKDLLMYVRL